MHSTTRRSILRGLAAGGVAALAGASAEALTARPASDYGAILDAACGASADHARQIAEVETALALTRPDPRLTEALKRTLCPNCGCPLAPSMAAPDAF